MNYGYIPRSIPCPKGCGYHAEGMFIPAVAILEHTMYWFINKHQPYMLRTCVKCETNWIIPL